ncbi:MAG: class I SAM-dependent methyltransferase [Deltaproteobacteria bacterium]|nr:class I SAM-dependent methyltransferase [Deltaproteobacteria bacterium]
MNQPTIFKRRFRRILCTFMPWFFPHLGRGVTVSSHWNTITADNFDALEPASIVLLDEIVSVASSKNDSILDMGCNVGRHLNYLHGKGFHNLRGVDFSDRAVKDMQERYPEMYRDSTITVASFQDFLKAGSEQVDIVYTRGATFELVPAAFPLIESVCRISKKYVILVISEFGHAYPRCWEYEFARAGFELVHLKRPAAPETPEHQVSLMTFKRLT